MANQDASVDFLSRLLANAAGDGVQYIGATIYLLEKVIFDSSIDSTVNGYLDLSSGSIDMSGSLSSTVEYLIPSYPGAVLLTGSLSSTVSNDVLSDSYAAMYGFGNMFVGEQYLVGQTCVDLLIDMEIQELLSSGCKIGDSDMITRYRGDDYPLRATLGKNGDFNITGFTFQMSTQIAGEIIYTSVGTIIDAATGIVEFPWPAGSIDTAGAGVYDIEGNDGTYTYTYDKGVFTILDDLTV